jgi:hypothetical protein
MFLSKKPSLEYITKVCILKNAYCDKSYTKQKNTDKITRVFRPTKPLIYGTIKFLYQLIYYFVLIRSSPCASATKLSQLF